MKNQSLSENKENIVTADDSIGFNVISYIQNFYRTCLFKELFYFF